MASSDPRPVRTATRIVRRDGAGARQVGVDICVVGAGIAGTSAALEAARLGGKVALVDGLHALGGQAVNSVIGTFCGLFSNGHTGYQLTHGIADGILRDLGAEGALHYRRGGPSNTVVVQYDEVALARWIERAVTAAGITVLLGAVMREVTRDRRRIRAERHRRRRGGARPRRLSAGGRDPEAHRRGMASARSGGAILHGFSLRDGPRRAGRSAPRVRVVSPRLQQP